MTSKIFRILDIDLDFFLNRKHNGKVLSTVRLEEEVFRPWSKSAVEKFLRFNCGLKRTALLKGKRFVHHHEVFQFLKQLQIENGFSLLFEIDHVDAHADLGFGDVSYKYISLELLGNPVEERIDPKVGGWEGLSPGNYLAFLVACRWVKSLNYINHAGWNNDLQWLHFKDFDTTSNVIQLKYFSEDQMKTIMDGGPDMTESARASVPISHEPEVPFKLIDSAEFMNQTPYDYLLLTQSPGFTPASADALISTIMNFTK